MPVCVGCGVIAPQQGSTCAVCDLDLMPERPAVPSTLLPSGRFWVAVRCQFQCRACGHLSPLNHLDMDGSVLCLRCGMSQIFDVSSWNEGLDHAHAVGDLGWPQPEGRFPGRRVSIAGHNPFHALGVSMTSAVLQLSGMIIQGGLTTTRSLRVEASPGHPLCNRCRAPLQVVSTSDAQISVACQACGDSNVYELPAAARTACKALSGVIADEHRLGSRDARVEQGGGGAEVIRCPNCSGAVSVTGVSTIVDCQYCHVSLRIPSRTLHRLGHHAPKPLVWWLLFGGPSPQRRALENQIRSKHRPQADVPDVPDIPAPPVRPGPERGIEQAPVQPHGRFARVISLGVALAVTGAVGMLWFGDDVQRWRSGLASLHQKLDEATRSTAGASSDQATSAAPEATPPVPDWPGSRSEFLPLRGCECKGKLAGKRVAVQLAVRVRDRSTPGVAPPVLDLAYFLDVGDQSYALAPAGSPGDPSDSTSGDARIAPPPQTTSRLVGIGMACHDDTAAIVAGKHVTGWSLAQGTRRWDAVLDTAYRYRGEASDKGLMIQCDQLDVRRGRVRVPVASGGAGGSAIAIDMATGKRAR